MSLDAISNRRPRRIGGQGGACDAPPLVKGERRSCAGSHRATTLQKPDETNERIAAAGFGDHAQAHAALFTQSVQQCRLMRVLTCDLTTFTGV